MQVDASFVILSHLFVFENCDQPVKAGGPKAVLASELFSHAAFFRDEGLLDVLFGLCVLSIANIGQEIQVSDEVIGSLKQIKPAGFLEKSLESSCPFFGFAYVAVYLYFVNLVLLSPRNYRFADLALAAVRLLVLKLERRHLVKLFNEGA